MRAAGHLPRQRVAVARPTTVLGRPVTRAPIPRPAVLAGLASIALSAAGLGVATYLTFTHYAHQQIACSGVGDCQYVNSTEYASLAGVSVALLGAAAYGGILALVAAWLWRRLGGFLLVAWGMGLAALAFSAYLTYVELFVIDAICVYCVASASIMGALFAALSVALWKAEPTD